MAHKNINVLDLPFGLRWTNYKERVDLDDSSPIWGSAMLMTILSGVDNISTYSSSQHRHSKELHREILQRMSHSCNNLWEKEREKLENTRDPLEFIHLLCSFPTKVLARTLKQDEDSTHSRIQKAVDQLMELSLWPCKNSSQKMVMFRRFRAFQALNELNGFAVSSNLDEINTDSISQSRLLSELVLLIVASISTIHLQMKTLSRCICFGLDKRYQWNRKTLLHYSSPVIFSVRFLTSEDSAKISALDHEPCFNQPWLIPLLGDCSSGYGRDQFGMGAHRCCGFMVASKLQEIMLDGVELLAQLRDNSEGDLSSMITWTRHPSPVFRGWDLVTS